MKRCKQTRFGLLRSRRASERRSLRRTSAAFEVPTSRLKTQSSAGEEQRFGSAMADCPKTIRFPQTQDIKFSHKPFQTPRGTGRA
ncbi:hypothetical protein Q8A67_024911 [Cirrhinus molitorella]|uniref:Uncharacterized protein n=1 Tax=Cirrhinus molitorella TaxID=172907 RepID=A0AA88P5F6_9TELE|nr:hypothetical protein Q8A67_024911 [Cirrhinus molitorella]